MRHLPLRPEDKKAMLQKIGVASIEDLFCDVPVDARQSGTLAGLPNGMNEQTLLRHMTALAAQNVVGLPSFLGGGCYRHYIPAIVDHLIQRGEFMTCYTPYQPEVSQGTLETLFEFQTQVARLTGMDVANASMYDGASAAAEAVLMARRITGRDRALLADSLHPDTLDTVRTLAGAIGMIIDVVSNDALMDVPDDAACVLIQNPDVGGYVRGISPWAYAARKAGALLVVSMAEPLTLGLIAPPGDLGADIVVAEGAGLAGPPNFGGPSLGLFACRTVNVRQMPGRLVGETIDADGKRGFVLTLATREQHIRRERATSNICTNSGLMALAFSIHMTLLGDIGFRRLAALNHARSCKLAERLEELDGVTLRTPAFFNEFTIRLPMDAAKAVAKMVSRGVLAGVPVSRLFPERPDVANDLLIAVTETATDSDMDALIDGLAEVLS